jgi:hypothetical protein
MKQRLLFFFFIAGLVLINSCKKEYSFENNENSSAGSLQSDGTGDCLPKIVAGFYIQGTALDGDSNYIEVQVDVTEVGSYAINTDMVNGINFHTSGVFTTTGLNTVRLGGTGTPLVAGIHNFIVTYDSTECAIAVTTLPGEPAVFTLDGAPGVCMGFVVEGTYIVSTPLTGSNTVSVNVDVTTIGIYNITTPESNGMTFTGTGVFAATGPQIIVLNGSGIPDAVGNSNIPVTVGSSSCNFSINVVGASAFAVDCSSAVVNGTHQEGVSLTAANTVGINVNVTTTGGYNITGTINGMTFAASGNFATTGVQNISLAGNGTPTDDGIFYIPLTGGSPTCNFQVIVEPAGTVDWKFTEGTSTSQGQVTDAALVDTTITTPVTVTLTIFTFEGDNTSGDFIIFGLSDVAGGIQNNETYSTSATITNSAAFEYIGATESYKADPTLSGVTLTFTVTNHNTSTKTIEGTFAGTVKDTGNNTKTITNGTFKGTYP